MLSNDLPLHEMLRNIQYHKIDVFGYNPDIKDMLYLVRCEKLL